jgi:hypothetical protein
VSPRIDINRGLFTDFPIVQDVMGGRWTPRVVRFLSRYNDVPDAILVLHSPDLEPAFHLLRQLLARPLSTALLRQVRHAASCLAITHLGDGEDDTAIVQAASVWFDRAADLIGAGDPIAWQRSVNGRLTAAAAVHDWLLRYSLRRGDSIDHRDEAHLFRDLVGMKGKTPDSFRMAMKKAKETKLDKAANHLGSTCGNLLNDVLNSRGRRLHRRRLQPRPRCGDNIQLLFPTEIAET